MTVTALVALGAVGGSVAYAYPSGVSMNVTAHAMLMDGGMTDVAVTVYNANPHCQINIQVEGASRIIVPAGRTGTPESTTFTRTATVDARPGQRRVTVTTAQCSARERAKTHFRVAGSDAGDAGHDETTIEVKGLDS